MCLTQCIFVVFLTIMDNFGLKPSHQSSTHVNEEWFEYEDYSWNVIFNNFNKSTQKKLTNLH